MSFRFADELSSEQLVSRLAAQSWWGAIVGPHGSGKSTLLEALKPALRAAGRELHEFILRRGERRLPQATPLRRQESMLVIVDGYDQFGLLARFQWKRFCRRRKMGLLVTSHRRTSLPTLIRLAPDRRLVQQLVTELTAEVSTPITPADVDASLASHGSNVREMFFDLYDRHERLRSTIRPADALRL